MEYTQFYHHRLTNSNFPYPANYTENIFVSFGSITASATPSHRNIRHSLVIRSKPTLVGSPTYECSTYIWNQFLPFPIHHFRTAQTQIYCIYVNGFEDVVSYSFWWAFEELTTGSVDCYSIGVHLKQSDKDLPVMSVEYLAAQFSRVAKRFDIRLTTKQKRYRKGKISVGRRRRGSGKILRKQIFPN